MSQGSVQTSGSPLDVAIQGKGLLVVQNDTGQFYTRAGNMHLDANGLLVSDNGSQLQGYIRNTATGLIDVNLGLNSIQMPSGVDNPVLTSGFDLTMNLDANAPDGAQFRTSIQFYDSLGTAHIGTLLLEKEITGGSTPSTRWRFDVTIPNNEVAGVASTNTDQLSLITGAVATGSPSAGALVFDGSGRLTSAYIGADPSTLPPLADITFPPGSVTLPLMASGASLSSEITWTLLSDPSTPNITALASPSDLTASTQNGSPAGILSSVSIGPDGTVSAVFNNGRSAPIAQLVLAQFSNLDGLVPQGGGFYGESVGSGTPFFGVPGEGGRGQLLSWAVEQSNVDLATELTKIITFQRGYQANARMVTVTDQLMQETMNMRQ
jgi:flagellar hook protein FlgE